MVPGVKEHICHLRSWLTAREEPCRAPPPPVPLGSPVLAVPTLYPLKQVKSSLGATRLLWVGGRVLLGAEEASDLRLGRE